MNASHRFAHGSIARLIATLSMVVAFACGSLPGPQADARQQAAPASLELPAMSLDPADLAVAGMPGYGLLEGQTVGTYALAGVAGDWTDQITDDDIEATLVDMGLIRGYAFGMRVREDPADMESELARDVYGSLHEFASETGASDALLMAALLETGDTDIQRIEATGAAGPNAVLVRTTFGEGADQTHSLTIAFQTGPVIGVLTIVDYLGQEPAVEEIETLAASQAARIESALQTGTLGLGDKVPRLEDPEFDSLYEIRRDEYLRRDGADIPLSFEEPEQLAQRAARADGATDVYALSQFIDEASEVGPDFPPQFGLGNDIYRFHDDTTASAWLADQPNQIESEFIGTDATVQDIQVLPDSPNFGDESLTLTYTVRGFTTGSSYRVFIRVANLVADVRVNPLGDIPMAAVEALAAVQAQCLGTTCPEPMLIADVLAGRIVIQEQTREDGTPVPPDDGALAPIGQEVIDLAAMTLMPADLESLGIVGFGSDYGQMVFPDTTIANTAASRGLTEAAVRDLLEGAGLVRRYEHFLYQPSESDPAGPAARAVVSYIMEFQTAEGAASAWTFLEDESASATSEDVPMTGVIGDQSEATHDANQDPASGELFDMIDLTFQYGNLHAGVAVIDWTGQAVDIAQVEALGRTLRERIDAIGAQGAPELSGQVIRLTGDTVTAYTDKYILMGGNAVRAYGASQLDTTMFSVTAAHEGKVDWYQVQQQLTAGTQDPADDGWYLLEVTRFADAESASAWMARTRAGLENNTAFTDLTFGTGPTVGEESFSYALTLADGTQRYQSVVFRIGAVAVSLDVATPEGPPPTVVEAIAQAQVACLERGGCPEPLPVPSGW
jgi:hypothetical protein